MTDTTPEKQPAKEAAAAKEPAGKEKFIRAMIALLTSGKISFYARGDRVYVDTRPMEGRGLMPLEGGELISLILKIAKTKENVLCRAADAELIIDHVRYHALEAARPLSTDSRAAHAGDDIVLNTGWADDRHIIIRPGEGNWVAAAPAEPIFEPIPPEMRMVEPRPAQALDFPKILREGIADFGEHHCLIAVSCATMLLPATFPHPFLVFTGDQARGKSTTMKLLLQLIDPYAGGELMTVGDDSRDLIALCRGRHCIALDNVSHLPFDEDLLSKMYSGGIFTARKMTTNSELSTALMPRLRVLINGIGPAFSRSDLLSRCMFIEHPVLTQSDKDGKDVFQPLGAIDAQWQRRLPEALGALLSAVADGWKLFLAEGGLEGKTSRCRYVEYCILGECFSRVMGFEPGLFTRLVEGRSESAREGAVEADDCAQLVVAYLAGERPGQLEGFGDDLTVKTDDGSILLSPSDLYKEVQGLARSRGYSTFGLKWLNSVKSFSTAIVKSRQNIKTAGWSMDKIVGGANNRKLKFTPVK